MISHPQLTYPVGSLEYSPAAHGTHLSETGSVACMPAKFDRNGGESQSAAGQLVWREYPGEQYDGEAVLQTIATQSSTALQPEIAHLIRKDGIRY